MNRQTLLGVTIVGLFAIPFVPLLVSSALFFPFITTKAFISRVVVEIVFSAWLILAIVDPKYRPKKSPLLIALITFLVVIGFANIFGLEPVKSFWSNFERMEGYIALLHLGAFFLVISTLFDTQLWRRWWNTSLAVSLVVSLIALREVFLLGEWRVDATFGNASYLAVYMLFHIFIAGIFYLREEKHRWFYGSMVVLQTFILYNTATRGALLGFLAGLFICALLVLSRREYRKWGVSALLGLTVIVGGFFLARNTSFVENSPVLSRFTTITTEELKSGGRSFIWPIALEGVKERPLLGWGQENFNYVFAEHYVAEMHHLEPWFDRAHNIFLDWAIAGGVLGLLAYLSLYFALLFILWKREGYFTFGEKSLITGLVVAYFVHNLFVFDHLVSYVLFFALLAYVSSGKRQEGGGEVVRNLNYPVLNLAVIFLAITLIYFVNWRPFITNTTIITALHSIDERSFDPALAIESFERASDNSRLGKIEAIEQMAGRSPVILVSDLPTDTRNDFFLFVKGQVTSLADKFPKDPKHQMSAGAFLSMTGQFEEGVTYLEKARELMPENQRIYLELGNNYFNQKDLPKTLDYFEYAYNLAPGNKHTKIAYLVGAIYARDRALENKLLKELEGDYIANDDRILSAYQASGRAEKVKEILRLREIGEGSLQ